MSSRPISTYANRLVASDAPSPLMRFFNGEGDLDRELSGRYPHMPLLSVIYLRDDPANERGLALMVSQDGLASLRVETDSHHKAVTWTFVFGSMLGLGFHLEGLSDLDRAYWLEVMGRLSGEPVFLWNTTRWRSDYLIGTARRHSISLYAASPQHTEAAARLTPEVGGKLLTWLAAWWGLAHHP